MVPNIIDFRPLHKNAETPYEAGIFKLGSTQEVLCNEIFLKIVKNTGSPQAWCTCMIFNDDSDLTHISCYSGLFLITTRKKRIKCDTYNYAFTPSLWGPSVLPWVFGRKEPCIDTIHKSSPPPPPPPPPPTSYGANSNFFFLMHCFVLYQ